jgi:tRNA pseudouridine32 synthase/23S rRNA pseudouridine746 synthase
LQNSYKSQINKLLLPFKTIKMPFQKFNIDVSSIEIPDKFTFPFYYQPHPLSLIAVLDLQNYLENQNDFKHNFGLNTLDHSPAIGKMFGVLVCKNSQNELGYLWAYSGKLADSNNHKKFVTPVFDMLKQEGFYKKEESILNVINAKIETILQSEKYQSAIENINITKQKAQNDLEEYKKKIKIDKELRDKKRDNALNLSTHDYKILQKKLSKESQDAQILLKKMQKYWKIQETYAFQAYEVINQEIEILKIERKTKSAALQQKLFASYQFTNSLNQQKDIGSIFNNNPPAGAGECAAPKLLHYCFSNNYKPVAMAEFWWGKSPNSEIRQHKNFYPACKSKCEPILMLHLLVGLNIEENPFETAPKSQREIDIVYEDEVLIVLNKPAEMLSVPGKTISESIFQFIKNKFPNCTGPLIVHRLDQSTSGIMLIAKDLETYKKLQQQFIKRIVKKRYVALLSKKLTEKEGIIKLPLRVDLEDRPRQLVCFEYGKDAETKWKTIEIQNDKTKVHFFPITGRTHQLRVHAAHQEGLNAPIVGDDLYGKKANRLHLHAEKITFIHPKTMKKISFLVKADF